MLCGITGCDKPQHILGETAVGTVTPGSTQASLWPRIFLLGAPLHLGITLMGFRQPAKDVRQFWLLELGFDKDG